MRLPLIWRPAPSAGVDPAVVTAPVGLVDLAPTFCSIAGPGGQRLDAGHPPARRRRRRVRARHRAGAHRVGLRALRRSRCTCARSPATAGCAPRTGRAPCTTAPKASSTTSPTTRSSRSTAGTTPPAPASAPTSSTTSGRTSPRPRAPAGPRSPGVRPDPLPGRLPTTLVRNGLPGHPFPHQSRSVGRVREDHAAVSDRGTPAVRPGRTITGMSAVLVPYTADGAIDWANVEAHIARTTRAGLTPAVNMDTGYVQLLDPADREQVLDLAQHGDRRRLRRRGLRRRRHRRAVRPRRLREGGRRDRPAGRHAR